MNRSCKYAKHTKKNTKKRVNTKRVNTKRVNTKQVNRKKKGGMRYFYKKYNEDSNRESNRKSKKKMKEIYKRIRERRREKQQALKAAKAQKAQWKRQQQIWAKEQKLARDHLKQWKKTESYRQHMEQAKADARWRDEHMGRNARVPQWEYDGY